VKKLCDFLNVEENILFIFFYLEKLNFYVFQQSMFSLKKNH